MEELLKELVELNEAIEAYGYLEEPAPSEDILTEALQLHIRQEDMPKIFQIPLGKIFATLNNADVFPLMREYNKKLSDYKLTGKDASLTINKMKIFIFINGTVEEKELLADKLASLEKKVARSFSHKENATIDVPYGSIKSIYSMYKRIEKKKAPLREAASAISDAKFSVKMDPEEYVIKDAFNHPHSVSATRALVLKKDREPLNDIANKRLDFLQRDPDLSAMMDELRDELAKRPIDRKKCKAMLKAFKVAYKKSSVAKDVEQELKLERINKKRRSLQLYEQVLDTYISMFDGDPENDDNIARLSYLTEQLGEEE